jgi:hypothetical protein
MRIISTTDICMKGNDNYIYKTISLTEQLGLYTISAYYYKNGFSEICGNNPDFDAAVEIYKDHGGQIKNKTNKM